MATVAEQWVLVEMVQALYEVRRSPEPPVNPRPGSSDSRPGSTVLPAPGERRGERLGCPRLLESRRKAALGRGAEDTSPQNHSWN